MTNPSENWFDRLANARERLGLAADLIAVFGFMTGLASIAAVVVALSGTGDGADPAPSAGPPLASSTPPVTAPSSPGSAPIELPSTAEEPPPVSAPLAERTFEVAGDSDLDFTDVSIGGDDFPASLRYHCDVFCNDHDPAVYQVNLGRKFRTFTFHPG